MSRLIRALRSLLPFLAAGLLVPGVAAAAPPWSAPAPVPGAPDAYPAVDFARDGTGMISWTVGHAAPDGATRTRGFGAPVAADGTVATARRLSGAIAPVDVALYGAGRVVAVGGRGRLDADGDAREELRVAFGRVGERLERPRRLLAAAASPVALDANPTGEAAVVTGRCPTGECRRRVPVLLVKGERGGFRRPVRLGPAGELGPAAVAVNAGGDVLAVWVRDATVHARVRTARGRLGRPQELGSTERGTRLAADLGPARRAIVAWGAQGVSEGEPTTPFVARAAYASPRRRFGAPQRLERIPEGTTGTYVSGAAVGAAVLRTGRVTVAWTGREAGRYVARAADVEGGRIRDAQVVSPAGTDSVLGALVPGPRGETVVLSITGTRGHDPAPGAQTGIAAAPRAAAEPAFGPLEEVYAGSLDPEGAVPAAADPATGRVLAAWRTVSGPIAYAQRPAPSPPPTRR